jgi:hypothetical protein
MNRRSFPSYLAVMLLVLIGVCIGGLRQGKAVQPQPPFRNAVEQREQMVQELREIKELLKQQNELLRKLQKV